MNPGLLPGSVAEIEVVVDESMFAAFEGKIVHPVLSTVAMIEVMELAGRRIILPYLEPDEEGVGEAIDVRHTAPTVAGMRVRVRATLDRIDGNRIICGVEARNDRGTIGSGTFTQRIVKKSDLAGTIAELEEGEQGRQST
jgi:predicted thioesterase